jgi:hypothetical protein
MRGARGRSEGAAVGRGPLSGLSLARRSIAQRPAACRASTSPVHPPSPPHSLSPLHVFAHPGHGMPVWETMPTLISQSSPAPRRPAVMVIASALRDSIV